MRLLRWLTLLLCALPAFGQGGNTVTIRFPGAPTGSCSPVAYGINNATGALYDCLAGAWNLVGGGGSGITGSGTAGKIPVFTGATAIGNGSLSDDAAGTVTLTGSFTVLPDTAITGTEVDSDKFCVSASCWYRGTGSPEGAVTASTGSYYTQTDSGTGLSAIWVKDNGVGNTGWQRTALVSTILRCYPGLGDGLNAITAGTYLQTNCYNNSGVTWTITRIGCFTDNAGSSTLSATNGAGTALLTGAVTCTAGAGGAAGTQSATVTIANGDVIKFTFIADGTSKQTGWFVSLTQ